MPLARHQRTTTSPQCTLLHWLPACAKLVKLEELVFPAGVSAGNCSASSKLLS